MKKLYVFITALTLGANVQSQTLIDFESFSLAPESYDNGSGGAGDFLFTGAGGFTFDNVYDTQWSSWTGFSISNITDNTTPGWLNQYSSFTGSGANSSANYAVFYLFGGIEATGVNSVIDSFKVTNTTYAALSMRDGDGWGKQFGSIYNGDSTVIDGTNGEDFFKLKIYVSDFTGNNYDSTELYLADYRFVDPTEDYILDEWVNVDMSVFAFDVHSISFEMESSDTTGGFINTPTYFALDDVYTSSSLGMNENQLKDVSLYPNPASDVLNIRGEQGVLTITSMDGRVVYESDHNEYSKINLSNFSSGIYAVRLRNASGSYTNQLIIE